jgi:ribokinase
MAKKETILVVGSINMDLVVRSPHMPAPGETILGSGFKTSFGGKGANQAVAVARLGGKCAMIGRVGDDPFGRDLVANLTKEGIDTHAVATCDDEPTGVAVIVVDSNGENSIVVASGANWRVTPDDDIFPNESLFEQAAVVLLQLELPLPTVRAAIEMAKRHGCTVILDPAPALKPMPEDLCAVDLLTPNISEAEIITGRKAGDPCEDKLIGSELIGKGARNVVLKLGPRGSLAVMGDGHFYTVPAFKVQVVDTTGAGDAFTGALAVATRRQDRLHDAVRFASAAGSLACTKLGAQSAMPTADEVEILMEDQPQQERGA